MWISVLTAVTEQIVNRLITLEPSLRQDLRDAEHRVLAVTLTDLNLSCALHYNGDHCFVYGNYLDSADCHITTALDTVSELKDPSQLTRLIRANKLDLQGDIHLAQAYSKAFSNLKIDWAEHVSRYLGDAGAQHLVNTIGQGKSRAQKHCETFEDIFTQLCQDELNVTVHPLELEQFKSQTRALSQHLSALEQRINALD
ncbi:SCP2 sterol-binding domain-containing protein [Pseudoalteromonas sp. SMS1]|uniref:ubiquinone biosynthesis accessory factor UbiJ n=1 Tax=Pseudoalteromonas sp. SMS1 TaxID=2908894 RepID=UPI001F390B11|nr:SCP2 sterol-binding domain-containing protein [Pseudoalteromonas sp. SMS1]MCF2859697.1 SCP2 sterol-binding domain-containing protein [Pseudoalteromonas sp. SMS1]